MDIVNARRRSAMMARIGPKDTAPELAVRRLAHKLGFRFRLHRRDLPGRPDLVFSRLHLALFVHGCFWHQHSGCKNCARPKTRVTFWDAKLQGNVARDHRNLAALAALGWRTGVIWECETQDNDRLRGILDRMLRASASSYPQGPARGNIRRKGPG